MVSNVSNVLLLPLIFWYCVKIVSTIKWWMENGDVANGDNKKLFLCHLGFNMDCHMAQIKINKSDLETQENQN